MVLVQPVNNRSGACFYKQPVNIATCQRWTAEFDYRIFDGTGADGIAFFFLNNPPRTYILGQGIGIPPSPLGLLVAIDPWNNCNNTGSPCCTPKLQIRYGNGINNYNECPTPAQPTISNVPEIRSTTYNRMRIEYDFGNVRVFINETLMLTGFYRINFAGYFGFTASTGGSNDRHSIKNFVLYTNKPILEAPNAGPDVTLCPNDTVRLGDLNSNATNYRYLWYPSQGLSDSTSPAPLLSVNNPNFNTQVLRYYVSKDTIANDDNRCSFTDEVLITVRSRSVALPDSFVACPTVAATINFAGVSGNTYRWSPTNLLSDSTRPNPTIITVNNGDTTIRYRYQLTGVDTSFGCVDVDSTVIVVPPNYAFAGLDKLLCSGDTTGIGLPSRPGATYSWFPGSQVIGSNRSLARFTGINNDTLPFVRQLILSAFNPVYQCNNFDTLQVRIAPRITFNLNRNQQICSGNSAVLAQNRSGFVYTWSPDFGLNNPNTANPVFSATNNFDAPTEYIFWVAATDTVFGCSAMDSMRIVVNPFPRISVGNDTSICSGAPILLGRNLPSVFGTFYQFINPPSELLPALQPLQVTLQPSRDTTVKYVLKGVFQGCEVFDTMQVNYQVAPQRPTISGRRVLCENSTAVLYRAPSANQNLIWRYSSNATLVAQSGDSLILNWGSVNPTGFVTVYAANSLGCRSVSDTLQVRVVEPTAAPLPLLDAVQPDTFCYSPGATYSVRFQVPNLLNRYQWYVSEGTDLVSGQGTAQILIRPSRAGDIKIAVLEQFVPGTDTCVGWSDTLRIHVLPKPAKPIVSGNLEPCQNILVPFDFSGSTNEVDFLFGSNADTLTRLTNTRVSARWNQPGNGFVRLQTRSREGCLSDVDTFRVTIQPTPVVRLLSGDTLLCAGFASEKTYAFNPFPGTTNRWTVLGGNVASASTDSASITVNWLEGVDNRLVFNRVSDKGCVAPAFTLRIRISITRGELSYVSLLPEEDGVLQLFPVSQTSTLPLPGELWRGLATDSSRLSTFDFAATVIRNSQEELPKENLPLFWATYQDACGNQFKTSSHSPIVLSGFINGEDSIRLHWLPYRGWAEGVSNYQVWYQEGAAGDFRLLELLPANLNGRVYGFGRQAFAHCFYIAANDAATESRITFSNKVCLDFENPLKVPNVVTLNEDGKNERFLVKNLELYSPSQLKVFNRLGKEVFSTSDYKQDWPSTDIQPGTYFYELKPGRSNKAYRGWVEVIK